MAVCEFESHRFRSYGPVVQRQRLLAHIQATVVQLHPGLLTPRYANGRAVRLKPECLQVQILLWVLIEICGCGSVGNWQTTLA